MTPKNPQEVLYVNACIVIATLFFAFYINEIWEIIGDLQSAADEFSDNWGNLKTILKDAEIPYSVKDKVGEYLSEIWMHEGTEQLE